MVADRVTNTEDLCSECDWTGNTETLRLESCGVNIPRKYIVDKFQSTNVNHVFALGDVGCRGKKTRR